MNLRLTDAGIAALTDAGHVGSAEVTLTHFAIGDGQGPGGEADDARQALRSERHRAEVAGTDPASGRIAFRARFNPNAGYGITEAGVFGHAGDPAGATELYAYWTDNGTEAGQAVDGVALVLAAVIEFANADADVAVTVSADISIGAAVDEATEDTFGTTRYATDAQAGDGALRTRAITPASMRSGAARAVGALLGADPVEDTVYQLKGDGARGVVLEERTQDPGTATGIAVIEDRIAGLEDDTRAATTARRGIVELATSDEARAGADAARAMTPRATLDATPDNIASLSAEAIEEDARYVLEGLAGGGLRLVRSRFLSWSGELTLQLREVTWFEHDEFGERINEDTGYLAESHPRGDDVDLGIGTWSISAWALSELPGFDWVGTNTEGRWYVDLQLSGVATVLGRIRPVLRFPQRDSDARRTGVIQVSSGTPSVRVLVASSHRSRPAEVFQEVGAVIDQATIGFRLVAFPINFN